MFGGHGHKIAEFEDTPRAHPLRDAETQAAPSLNALSRNRGVKLVPATRIVNASSVVSPSATPGRGPCKPLISPFTGNRRSPWTPA